MPRFRSTMQQFVSRALTASGRILPRGINMAAKKAAKKLKKGKKIASTKTLVGKWKF